MKSIFKQNLLAAALVGMLVLPALRTAVARKVFARGFKREVRVTPDFVGSTEQLLERAALDALAIAHKAGSVAIGFAKVESAIARDPVVGVLHAAEAAPDGGRKLASALRRRFADNADRIPVINTLTSAQLDLALGRPNVIHAALLKGPASETFLTRVARLDHFRADGPNSGGPGTARTKRNRGGRKEAF